jgi:negative regulator of replication initiation
MSDNGCAANWPSEKYDHLGDLAKRVVLRVMQEGEATHPANDYMKRRLQDHASHAKTHLETAWKDIVYVTRGGLTHDELKDELEHALARVVILLAKLQMEVANA